MNPAPRKISRRRFLGRTAAALAFPTLVSSAARAAGAAAPSEKITVGLVGAGPRGLAVINGFLVEPAARVVAVCDVKPEQLARGRDLVNRHYENRDCAAYADFRELLARPRAYLPARSHLGNIPRSRIPPPSLSLPVAHAQRRVFRSKYGRLEQRSVKPASR